MAEGVEKRSRRKSLSVFPPLASSLATPPGVHDRSSSDGLYMLKKKRRNSGFFSARNPSPVRASSPLARPETASSDFLTRTCSIPVAAPDESRPRRKSLQKQRRSSVFGSLRGSLHSEDDDRCALGRSKGSSGDDEDVTALPRIGLGSTVLHHGELQTAGGMWRRKTQYLVMTETHLIRFKSINKAAEKFPSISPQSGYAALRQSLASVGSFQDMQQVADSSSAGIPLSRIVAVYRSDDARPSLEVWYIDERTQKPAFMQLQTADPQDLDLWLVGIRSAAEAARAADPFTFDQRSVEYVASILEQERDYDPANFHMFRVVQRSSSKPAGRSSDDMAKLPSTVCYLAIGPHKVHLLPLNKPSSRASVVSVNELETGVSFGLMTLTSLAMQWGDDSFQLVFRVPLRDPFSVVLASVHAGDIALWIRQLCEFLRPLWLRQPFDYIVPRELDNEDLFPPPDLSEDYGCFDRTLIAYSAAYDVDTSNIRYMIDHECEDAPCFKLLPPASPTEQRYSALELLAVLRALRYNESFRSISFSGVNLDVLQGVHDPYGPDRDAQQTRAGTPIKVAGQDSLSVLSQEIRALALKSKALRRLDFSCCLTRTPVVSSDDGTRDPGCGIPEAIFPILRRQLTNVDWVVLNGIRLGESDVDYLVDAASQKTSHFRALEVSDCGLSVHDLDLVLSTLTAQENTLEAINISGAQGRLSPEVLQQQIGHFSHMRKIDLSRISRTSGSEPLIPPETLMNWRLEELSLSQTTINEQTIDAIAAYLASDKSRSLRDLRLDQCGLTGEDVAVLLRSMDPGSGKPSSLHLHISENRLDTGCSALFEAIARSQTPTHITMRMVDFKKEEHFRQLIEALRTNKTLKYLDISKASLPYDAGPETCKALQLMFEENDTLEELDLSADCAHLDVARFGIGLNEALTGLKKNRSLRVLRIENQKLGLQGANTLASVLEENNTLREVYCENNDLNLQSFTVLVNGLQRNRSILHLPSMDRDRELSLERVCREFENRDYSHSQGSSLRRSIHNAINGGHPAGGNKLVKHPPTPTQPYGPCPTSPSLASTNPSYQVNSDVQEILLALNQRWDLEVARLRRYLFRNYNIAHGLDQPVEGSYREVDDAGSDGRPDTAASLTTMLERMKLDLTVSANEVQTGSEMPHPGLNSNTATSKEDKDTESSASFLTVPEFKPRSLDAEPDSNRQDHARPPSPLSLSPEPSSKPPTSRDYAPSYTSSPHLALPVPSVAPPVSTASSARSTRSNSTVSTGTTNGGGTGARSPSGVASSSLRGFPGRRAASREGETVEQVRDENEGPVYVSSDQPPRLTLPKFDFETSDQPSRLDLTIPQFDFETSDPPPNDLTLPKLDFEIGDRPPQLELTLPKLDFEHFDASI